jgi:CDGSH-type Zn-finger protein
MPDVTIHTDGPIVVPTEGLELKGSDGSTIELPKGSAVALCRCGQAGSKPFCDGTHKNAGFANDPTK